MRIKHNATIAAHATAIADELGIKPSRSGWAVRAEQAERLLRMDNEPRPTTRRAKKGKQALVGRTRVDRAREEVVTVKRIFELENMLADMAITEIMRDERGHWYKSPQYVGLRWTHPAKFACGVGAHHAVCWYVFTVEGLMAFEAELYYRGVLPRGYVTPDEIVRVTGRQLGK